MTALRPFQIAGIEKFLSRPDKRLIFAWATSAGKTLGALECARRIGAKRILVVAPAMARANFVREFAKWVPEYAPEPVRYGRTRKSLTKAQTAQRDASYQADVKVVSYDLLASLLEPDARPHDIVIFDEFHNLREPTSQQSRIAKKYMRAYKKTPAIGMTGTLIPTEVYNVWNPIDTLFPGVLGRPGQDGGVPWSFKLAYCEAIENEYATGGYSFKGEKSPEDTAALAELLSPFVHIVSDAEVAPYLPKLDAGPLYLDVRTPQGALAYDWLEDDKRVHQVCVFFHRESAHDFAAQCARHYPDAYVLTGEIDATKRDKMVQEARTRPGSLIIATSEAIRESISLAFANRVLIQEWRTTPAQALQLMGRFRRSDGDPTRPPKIQYVVQPGDESRAELLSERIRAVQNLMGKSQGGELLEEIFKPRPLTEERLQEMSDRAFATMRTDLDDFETDDSDSW